MGNPEAPQFEEVLRAGIEKMHELLAPEWDIDDIPDDAILQWEIRREESLSFVGETGDPQKFSQVHAHNFDNDTRAAKPWFIAKSDGYNLETRLMALILASRDENTSSQRLRSISSTLAGVFSTTFVDTFEGRQFPAELAALWNYEKPKPRPLRRIGNRLLGLLHGAADLPLK